MGCHGNHAFSHSPYQIFLGQLCHSGDPNEQFGTHEKLSWGGRGGGGGLQGNLSWMPWYWDGSLCISRGPRLEFANEVVFQCLNIFLSKQKKKI